MLEVFINIIVFPLIFTCANAVHEFAHLLGCLILKCRLVDLKIPFLVLYRDGKCRFMFTLKEHNHCTFAASEKFKAAIITLMGPVIDLLVIIALLFIAFKCFFMWGILLSAIVIFCFWVYNLLPNINGDGALLRRLFKEK